jgi:hypothetical protein
MVHFMTLENLHLLGEIVHYHFTFSKHYYFLTRRCFLDPSDVI